MSTEQALNFTIPKDGASKAEYDKNITELERLMLQISSEKESIKEILDDMKAKFKIPPKYLRKIVQTKVNANFNAKSQEQEAFEELYNETFSVKQGSDISQHREPGDIRAELEKQAQEDRKLDAEDSE